MKLINKGKGLTIKMEDMLLKKLCKQGIKYYPNEFGGLLVGYYVDDNKTVVITETVLPAEFKSSRFSFERGSKGLKKILEDLYKQSPSLIYVGEWHTHPDNPAVPSRTDMNALQEIVTHEGVFINNPILLIISITKNKCEPGFFVYANHKVYKYEEEKERAN